MTQTTLIPERKLILVHNALAPSELAAHVSPAKVILHPTSGKEIVAVRHSLTNVQKLQALGIDSPSPILTDYKWPGKYPPMSHQRETADFLTRHAKALVLSDMGTGKTASSLWSADYLMRMGKVRKVLIVAPLSCLNRVWMDEIFQWLPHRSGEVLHAARDRRKYLALRSKADFLIINHDGMGVVKQELIDRKDIDLIIYDEASALRNAQTDRYRLMRDMMKALRCGFWPMTGTPTPNAPTDAWALARLVNPENTPRSFVRFRESTMYKVTQFKWRPRQSSDIVVRKILQPAIRHKKEDCIDLPDTTYIRREVMPSKQQVTAFLQMKRNLMAEAAQERTSEPDKAVTALNAASKLIKLLQICTGSVYADDGTIADLPMKDRFDVMEELIRQSSSKSIVCVPFRHTIARVERELRKRGFDPGVVHGGVTGLNRDKVIGKFQLDSTTNPLLVQPKTASHGLNLTCASTLIWFGPVFSSETYQQANERMARPGQQNKMTIAHLGDNPVEWGAYDVVAEKGNRQAALLSLYETTLGG